MQCTGDMCSALILLADYCVSAKALLGALLR